MKYRITHRLANSAFAALAILSTAVVAVHTAQAQSVPLVRAIEFEVRTGSDNLRGGNDNAFVAVLCKDDLIGRGVVSVRCGGIERLNAQRQELKDYTQTFRTVVLSRPRRLAHLRDIVLFVEGFGGGFNGDNWNVDVLRATVVFDNGRRRPLFQETGLRFTGNMKKFVRRMN